MLLFINDKEITRQLPPEVYHHSPYVIVGDEGCILWSGSADELVSCPIIATGYYDGLEVIARQYDLFQQDNSKI